MRRGIRRAGGIPGTGCQLDTDGDGNCPAHPYGCVMARVEREQEDQGSPDPKSEDVS